MNDAGEYEIEACCVSCLPNDLVSSNWRQLTCTRETGNPTDRYAVAIL